MTGLPSGPITGFRSGPTLGMPISMRHIRQLPGELSFGMVAVVGDKFSGLSARFNDARALWELIPDAVDLNVEEFGWCAHRESSVVSGSVPISLSYLQSRKTRLETWR